MQKNYSRAVNQVTPRTRYCLLFGTVLLANAFYSPAAAQDSDAGKAFAKDRGCFDCHGLTGNTGHESDPPVPKLAGQPVNYLIKAMKDYRDGHREAEMMSLLMAPLSNEEIELLAKYFGSQDRY